jgi:hypothetical protein
MTKLAKNFNFSQVSVHCADSDIERTYPAIQIIMNACKDTTVNEMVSVEGMDYMDIREHGLNLTGGHVNATRFCVKVLGLPTSDTLLDSFMRHNGLQ